MSVRTNIPYDSGIFFITITCSRWLHLFELANSYDAVYKWFDYLIANGHYINSFVIMPNHLHAIISFRQTDKSINKIIGDGKRFMAYEIVGKLKSLGETEVLLQLQNRVNNRDKNRNKIHEVFEPSFDWKLLESDNFMEQKLDYIHYNPCKGDKPLVKLPEVYIHSSASYYINKAVSNIKLTHIGDMKDINLTLRPDAV